MTSRKIWWWNEIIIQYLLSVLNKISKNKKSAIVFIPLFYIFFHNCFCLGEDLWIKICLPVGQTFLVFSTWSYGSKKTKIKIILFSKGKKWFKEGVSKFMKISSMFFVRSSLEWNSSWFTSFVQCLSLSQVMDLKLLIKW